MANMKLGTGTANNFLLNEAWIGAGKLVVVVIAIGLPFPPMWRNKKKYDNNKLGET